jgi:aspartate-semialdehyde dehydrogenase
MKIAVVGATGLVGREMMKILVEHKVPFSQIIPVASPKSFGITQVFNGKEYTIQDNDHAVVMKPDIAIFSAGAATSREWAPKYAAAGTTVIDNSSAWRMQDNIPLVVPEINGSILSANDKIIANPNCSTIGLVMVLFPLHLKYKIKRVVVSTYQSVTGTGIKALHQLENERKGIIGEMAYPYPIDLNLIPHGGDFLPSGYTTEEEKLVNETRKILSDQTLNVTATVVRVPVYIGHSESVNIEFYNGFKIEEVRLLLTNMKGVIIHDDPSKNLYPMPILAQGKDEVFVGRIRRDESNPNSLNLFLVSDNLRKGAATNAIQIINYLISNYLV